MDKREAEVLLRSAVGDPHAAFRSGQWEAIDALVNRRRKLLIVQRTGWGKSAVYFISTRILRDRGAGPTLIISPLLGLMRNQVEAARRLGLRAETINSTNRSDHDRIKAELRGDEIDALLISPEQLSNDDFVQHVLLPVGERVGMLVVDEAHCISDWGHDFRPDYRRLVSVLRQLPPNMPLLGTTATANDRVVNDVRAQLGDIEVMRGPLARDSLMLQTLHLADQAERLAWLAQHIPSLRGTGIVYVLTKRDADQVARWLRQNEISARAYYSDAVADGFADSNAYREHLEALLLDNELDVLVATTALGMGYDKPDLHFVIHYQAPGSVVDYYQQVGRAGRAIRRAYGVLLAGREDEEIHDHFRRNAFPPEEQVEAILSELESCDGLSVRDLESRLNIRSGKIDKTLKILSVATPSPVYKDGSHWLRTPVRYRLDRAYIQRLAQQREIEWRELVAYVNTDRCLMAFLREALDDPTVADCGRCASCRGSSVVDSSVAPRLVRAAKRFLRQAEMDFDPKKQVAAGAFPNYGFRGNLAREERAEPGKILANWGDAGWGRLVADGKHAGHFSDELVEAMAEMIEERWRPNPEPEWVTCVPSHRHPELVPAFARRLAARLGLPFVNAIAKTRENAPQKAQQNRFHQCRNLDGVFEVPDVVPDGPVLLVDDIIDSGWTMTVLAALLRRAGSGPVFPVALASSRGGD